MPFTSKPSQFPPLQPVERNIHIAEFGPKTATSPPITMQHAEPLDWPPADSKCPWKKFTTVKAPNPLDNDLNSQPSMEFSFLNDPHCQSPASGDSRLLQLPINFFSRLPPELRARIWELSLPRQRLLRVSIAAGGPKSTDASSSPPLPPPPSSHESAQNTAATGSYEARNVLGNIVSGADYVLRMRSTGSCSPLLRVNRESNEVVSRRYRVHVPVTGRQPQLPGGSAGAPRLRFCPETDTVFVSVEDGCDEAHLADFVHDGLACDPQRVGILHMAIGCDGPPSTIRLPLDPSSLHSRARAAFACTLSKLHSMSLIHIVRNPEARQMFSSLLHAETRFNRAFPLWSSAASFSAPQQDPRPIACHLDKVCVGWDPRAVVRAWRVLEAAYEVPPTAPEKMRVLLAAAGDDDDDDDLASREKARRFRRREEDAWKGRWAEGGFHDRLWPSVSNPDGEESLEFARMHNAVGFWSVPLDAFGDVPEVEYDTHRWPMVRVIDLTSFRSRIDLGLFELAGR